MSSIEIEYCGAWGYGGPATRLKDRLSKDLGVPVSAHSASGTTSVIEVRVCKGGNKDSIWKKGKAETEAAHNEIVGLAKKALWMIVKSVEQIVSKWGELLKLGEFFEEMIICTTKYL